jgi:hypothetical protein
MDPHSFGCPGFGSAMGMRIRIKKHENLPKFTSKPGFLRFKGAFVSYYAGSGTEPVFLPITYYFMHVFYVKIKPFVTLTSERIRIRIGLAPWIQIHIEI